MNAVEIDKIKRFTPVQTAIYLAAVIEKGDNIKNITDLLTLNKVQSVVSWFIANVPLLKDTYAAPQKRNQRIIEIELDDYRHSLIHLAILRKHSSAIKCIYDLDPSNCFRPLNILNENVLHIAIWTKSFPTFRQMIKLINKDTIVQLCNHTDIFGLQPLSVLYLLYNNNYKKLKQWRNLLQDTTATSYLTMCIPSRAEQLLIPLLRKYLLLSNEWEQDWRNAFEIKENANIILTGFISLISNVDSSIYKISMITFIVMSSNLQLLNLIVPLIYQGCDTLMVFDQVILGLQLRTAETMYQHFGFKHFYHTENKRQENKGQENKPQENIREVLVDSGLIRRLIECTPQRLWNQILKKCATSYEMDLLNYVVELGLKPDMDFCESKANTLVKSLAPLPSEELWHLNQDKKAIACLFRADSNWLPDAYQDPRNFFTKLFSNSKEPQHLWWQFVDDFDICLHPNDVHWKNKEVAILTKRFQQMNPVRVNKLKFMKGNCIAFFEEIPASSLSLTMYGPSGACQCAMCPDCLKDFAHNMYKNWGKEVVKCPGEKCKQLLHYSFIQQLFKLFKFLTEDQYRSVARRQFKNWWIQQNPDWRFCSEECIGGKAIPLGSASNFLQCEFCWKRGCYICGAKHALCDDSKQDIATFRRILEQGSKVGGTDRPCPNKQCNELIHREFGCNGVVCYKCKVEFHWNYGAAENIPLTMKLKWSPYMTKYNKLVPHDSEEMSRQYKTIHDAYLST